MALLHLATGAEASPDSTLHNHAHERAGHRMGHHEAPVGSFKRTDLKHRTLVGQYMRRSTATEQMICVCEQHDN